MVMPMIVIVVMTVIVIVIVIVLFGWVVAHVVTKGFPG